MVLSKITGLISAGWNNLTVPLLIFPQIFRIPVGEIVDVYHRIPVALDFHTNLCHNIIVLNGKLAGIFVNPAVACDGVVEIIAPIISSPANMVVIRIFIVAPSCYKYEWISLVYTLTL